MDSGSRDCFSINRIFTCIRAFTAQSITTDWRASGLAPFNVDVIFEKCVAFAEFSEDEANGHSRVNQVVWELSKMRWLLGDIVPRPCHLVDGRQITHLRSLWLNHEGGLERRQQELPCIVRHDSRSTRRCVMISTVETFVLATNQSNQSLVSIFCRQAKDVHQTLVGWVGFGHEP
jgi:hypothetical protein